jgi:EpsI family protein
MRSPRYWTVVLLLVATALLLRTRGDVDRVPVSDPLSQMPRNIGIWTSRDIPIDDDVLTILGKGDFLNRVYTPATGIAQPVANESRPAPGANQPIGLFIGYFPTQRTGQSIHSPQHCLPGAGWTFESQSYVNLQDINGKNYKVGEYVINNGEAKQFVIYWYQAHGRSIANEYVAKAYMIADAIRSNRTDGALVRVITAISPSETVNDARQRAIKFTSQMATHLSQFIPD